MNIIKAEYVVSNAKASQCPDTDAPNMHLSGAAMLVKARS